MNSLLSFLLGRKNSKWETLLGNTIYSSDSCVLVVSRTYSISDSTITYREDIYKTKSGGWLLRKRDLSDTFSLQTTREVEAFIRTYKSAKEAASLLSFHFGVVIVEE